jgi:hypothetical protein
MTRILSMEMQLANLMRSAKAEPWASPWAAPGTGIPAPVDKKLMERPCKYKGDIKVFIQWHERLKTFLTAQDKRWPRILEAIEARGPKALRKDDLTGADDYKDISDEADVADYHDEFSKQLYLYLDAFTDGPANVSVTTAGATMVYETYRRLAEKGRSRRPEHVLRLHTEVLQPAQVGQIKDLEASISTWEHNVEYFHRVNPQKIKITDEEMRLILTAMAPKELQDHLLKECDKFRDYEMVKSECMDWIHRLTAPKNLSGALHSLAEMPAGAEESY